MSTLALEIQEPGLQTTVQDKGRYGYQRYGVPVAGAMDLFALRAANILVGNHHYFLSWKNHFIGRVNVISGETEYLQVPVLVDRRGKQDVVTWDKAPLNDTRNSRGVDVGVVDKRSKGDGWGHVSAASPIVIGDRIYFTTMLGMVYVIDASAPRLDAKSLLSMNDMGAATQTWSLASLSFANNRIYHRTMKEVVCLGKPFE